MINIKTFKEELNKKKNLSSLEKIKSNTKILTRDTQNI